MREYQFKILYRGTFNIQSIFSIKLTRIAFFHKLEELQQIYGRPHVKWIEK